MKKQILLLLSVALSSIVIAQDRVSFGIRGGLSSSGMKGEAVNNLQNLLDVTDGMITTRNQAGMFAGAHVSIPLGGQLYVEPGVYYAQKGYELHGSLDIKGIEFLGAGAKARLKSHYIDIPVLLKADFNGLQVFAGPQVSYLARADLKTTAGVLGFNLLNKTFDVTDEFSSWDAGLTGGIAYRFPNGFNVSASYDHGLSRVDANRNLDSYNRSFKLGVGFSF